MREEQPGVWEQDLRIYRHAAGPRGVARAGEIWRLCQEVAVGASISRGWTPERFLEAGTAFVVRSMVVRHHREAAYGEPLRAYTWIHDFRRGVLSRRDVRLFDLHGPVADATQQWVHVNAALRLVRASPELLAAFVPVPSGEPAVALPTWDLSLGERVHRFPFRVWHTWMDPLSHVNHPVYVDWCDEATSQALAAAGADPQRLLPVAERVDWRRSAVAGAEVAVTTRVLGRTAEGDAVLEHAMADADNPEGVYAMAVTVRRLAGGTGQEILDAMG